MTLEIMPDFRDTVIVVGTSVRKNLPILRAYLDSLEAQELPSRHRLHPVFTPDFTDEQEDAREYLFKWVNERNGDLLLGETPGAPDFREGPVTHEWSPSAMARVGQNKNYILRRALELKADYVFLCDADVILDRTTIASLIAADKPVTTAVYYTVWAKDPRETVQHFASPQVWLRHPYSLDGRGMDEPEFRRKLRSRQLTRVWGFGACTLIKRSVLESGVDFSYLPGVSTEGMMAGEDRHFSIATERRHLEAYADPWPDLFHVYHPDDVARIPAMQARLHAPHPDRARVGDLVSLRLRHLEPFPVSPGRVQHIPPYVERGRLGQIALLPELEAAVLRLTRGEKQIVRCHFPVDYEMPFLRGRIRLMEVVLLDCKPFSYPPVLESDLLDGQWQGVYTADQQESITEVAG